MQIINRGGQNINRVSSTRLFVTSSRSAKKYLEPQPRRICKYQISICESIIFKTLDSLHILGLSLDPLVAHPMMESCSTGYTCLSPRSLSDFACHSNQAIILKLQADWLHLGTLAMEAPLPVRDTDDSDDAALQKVGVTVAEAQIDHIIHSERHIRTGNIRSAESEQEVANMGVVVENENDERNLEGRNHDGNDDT